MTRGHQTRHELLADRSRRTCHEHSHHRLLDRSLVVHKRSAFGPASLTSHHARNLHAKLPHRERERVKHAYWQVLDDAISEQDAKHRLQALVDNLDKDGFTAAARCLADDLDALVVHLRYPVRHRRRWRSTNLLERSLGEVKRRTKVTVTRNAVAGSLAAGSAAAQAPWLKPHTPTRAPVCSRGRAIASQASCACLASGTSSPAGAGRRSAESVPRRRSDLTPISVVTQESRTVGQPPRDGSP